MRKKRPPHDPDRTTKVQEMYAAGDDVRTIAADSPRRTKARRTKAEKGFRQEAWAELREWNRINVRADYDAGLTYRAIATKYKKSLGWVQKQVDETGGPSGRPKFFGTSKLSDEQKQDIAWRYAIREDVHKIAKEYEISDAYIVLLAKERGFRRGSGPGVMEYFRNKAKEMVRGKQE